MDSTTRHGPLRVLIAEDREEDRHLLLKYLGLLGHQVVGVAETGRQLVRQCLDARPDVVIADVKMPDMDGIEASLQVGREFQVPFVLVSAYHEDELLERAGAGQVMAYLVKPVAEGQLKATLALARQRFEQFESLRNEADSLRQALEDRKLVERAKGTVMRRLGVGEEEAFRRLKKMSAGQNRKLVEVARSILAAEEIFRTLDLG